MTNPAHRAQIAQIKNHEWLKKFNSRNKGLIIDYHEIPIDKDILSKLYVQKKVSKRQLKFIIKKNYHNQLTVSYYLLLKEKIATEFSEADISHESFVPLKLLKKQVV